jgi:HD-like signal output (HDOD) protein
MKNIKLSLKEQIISLPPLPESVLEIERICRNPDTGINELSVVVEQDPLLTANLLRTANSAFFGFASEVTSISQAVSLFGMSMVWGFAIEAATRQSFVIDLSPYGISVEQFANISRAESALMFNWLSKEDPEKATILIPSSFISRIGMVIIAAQMEEHGLGNKFLQEINANKGNINDIERKYIGNTHQEVCGAIFSHWKLENTMVKAIWSSENPAKCDDLIKPYAYALKTVHTVIPYNGEISKESCKESLNVAREGLLPENILLDAIEKITK